MKLVSSTYTTCSYNGVWFKVLVETYKTVYHITAKRVGYALPEFIAYRVPRKGLNPIEAINISFQDNL